MSLNNAVIDTLHVNLWGIPGTGKKGVCSELHSLLTRTGASVELIQEYAKELGWAGQLFRQDANGDLIEVDQFVISAEQYRRENMVHGLAQIALTEAPVLAGVLYAHEDDEAQLRSLLRRRTSGWRNLDVLLHTNIGQRYGSRGRIQSREEAIAMMPRIEELLVSERPDFIRLNVEDAAQSIATLVIRELKRSHTPGLF